MDWIGGVLMMVLVGLAWVAGRPDDGPGPT